MLGSNIKNLKKQKTPAGIAHPMESPNWIYSSGASQFGNLTPNFVQFDENVWVAAQMKHGSTYLKSISKELGYNDGKHKPYMSIKKKDVTLIIPCRDPLKAWISGIIMDTKATVADITNLEKQQYNTMGGMSSFLFTHLDEPIRNLFAKEVHLWDKVDAETFDFYLTRHVQVIQELTPHAGIYPDWWWDKIRLVTDKRVVFCDLEELNNQDIWNTYCDNPDAVYEQILNTEIDKHSTPMSSEFLNSFRFRLRKDWKFRYFNLLRHIDNVVMVLEELPFVKEKWYGEFKLIEGMKKR